MSTVGKSTQPYSSFDPRTLGDCALWLDAADRNSLTLSGSTVTAWADKSPNNVSLTLSNGVGGSTVTSTLSNRPIVQFSNSCFYNASFSFPLASRSIFFVVAELVHSDWRGLVNFANTTGQSDYNTVNGYAITSTNTIGSNVQFSQNGYGNGGFTYNYNAGTGSLLVPFQVYADVASNTSVTITITGSNAYSTTTSVTPQTSTGFTVAGRGGGPNQGTLAVAEVILFSNALTTSQRQQVEGYLAWKWGISSSFQPTSLPGCSLWLDGADASSMTLSGSNVTQWNDKSGNSRHATASTLWPTKGTNSILFDGTQTMSGTANYLHNSSDGTWTAFAAFFPTTLSNASNPNPRILNYQATPNNVAQFLYFNTGTLASLTWLSAGGVVEGLGTTLTNNTAYIGGSVNTTSNITVYVNGTAGTSVSHGAPTTVSNTNYILGGYSSSQDRFVGSLYELLVYNSALSTTQRQQVEDYLSRKWSITLSRTILNLPTSHPFRLAPPVLRPFSPLDIANCALWLDAADQLSMTLSGSNVTAWADKSGNAKNLSQATTSLQPTLSNNGVFFPTTSNTISNTTSIGLGDAYTAYIVFNPTTSTGAVRPIRVRSGGSRWFLIDINQINFQNSTAGQYQSYTTVALNTPVLVGGNIASSVRAQYGINGSAFAEMGSNYFNTDTATDVILGANAYTGFVHEVLVYNAYLTTSQRQQVENYLAGKWGLRGSTPATHPARLAPALSVQFQPNLLSNCALWLDAADRSSIATSGGYVTQWNDKSGNSRHASNVGTGVVSGITALNGINTLQFASGSYLLTPSFTMNTLTRTAFVVYKFTSNSYPSDQNYYSQFFLVGTNYPNSNAFSLENTRYRGTGDAVSYGWFSRFVIGAVGSCPEGGVFYTGASGPANTAYLLGIQRSTLSTGRVSYSGSNSAVTFTGTAASTAFTATEAYRIGDTLSNTQIAEVLYYNSALSTSDFQQIEGYLAAKWGLLSSLPSTHPYRYSKLY